MKPEPQKRICGDCIHEYACNARNPGNMHNTDARNCANYETVKTSNAYYIGVQDGKKLASGGDRWIAEKNTWVCPYCRARFKYELWIISASNKIELPNCCPNCGERMKGGG